MSQVNPQNHAEDLNPTQQGELQKQDVLGEIQELKKVILNLERRHLIKTRSKINEEKDSSEQLRQKARNSQTNSSSSRLTFGEDFKQEINHSFRTRHIHQHSKGVNSHSPSILEKEEDEKSIIDAFQASGLNLVSQKPDSEEEEPARTQLFTPLNRSKNPESSELHFKKVNLIPNIEEENHKFYSYMKSYREKKVSSLKNRFKKDLPSTATSQQPSASQSQLIHSKAGSSNIVDEFLKINLEKNSSKETVVEVGQLIFKHFLGSSLEVPNFTIKKYKNCIVFSLMPQQTKAAIWYYSKELYFGTISLTEEGRVERNGFGVQWVEGRHFYQGHFVNGQKNGRGKILYKNRDQYDGQWLDGQIYGFGRFTEEKSQKKYEGFWRNGQFCGQAPKDPFESDLF